MKTFFYDSETHLIEAGVLAPRLVCLTCCIDDQPIANLLNREEGIARMREVLQGDMLIIGHNVAFDMAVLAAADPSLLPLIFQAYTDDRVSDTLLRQQLADIADGRFRGYADSKGVWRKRDYSLSALAARFLGAPLEKDAWRLKYGELDGIPIEQWPEGARTYPRLDAQATRDVFYVQEQQWGPSILCDQHRQARAAWALHLASAWGLHTDEAAVRALEASTVQARNAVFQTLLAAGLVRANGSRDTKKAKAAMLSAMGDNHRKTATGDVCLDADACEASEDPLLEAYAEYSTLDKVLSNDIPALYKGTTTPIQTRYGLADTGRTTSSGPNIQNVRRLPGIRECFRPRPGYVYAQADYHAFELFALAQTCLDLFGESKLAEALNAGLDPHTQVAATILGRPYNEALALVKAKDHDAVNARQVAKALNFGLPGGLGAPRFVQYAAKADPPVILTEAQAREYKATWLQAWPEMTQFFAHVNTLKRDNGYTVRLKRSGRFRGGASYCAALNSHFQALAADGAKEALFLIAKACYSEPDSPLFGSRLTAFVHDECIAEAPIDKAPEAAEELSRLMVLGAKKHMPDMKLSAEPALMRFWSKKAETIRDEKGRLEVWPKTP